MKTTKAILLTPPFQSRFIGMPVALLFLGAELRRLGIDTHIIDISTLVSAPHVVSNNWEAMVKDAVGSALGGELFFGISTTSPALFDALGLARFLKNRWPDSIICMGGYHFHHDQDFLHDSRTRYVDWVVHGQTPNMKDLAHAIGDRIPPSNLVNVSYRANGGVVQTTWDPRRRDWEPRMLEPADMTLMQIASRQMMYRFESGYFLPNAELIENMVQLQTTNHCPFSCTFCVSANGGGWEIPVSRAISYIHDFARSEYGFIFFDDLTFTLNPSRYEPMIRALGEMNVLWACQTRLDRVDENLLRKMYKSGCRYIFYGLESGAPAVKSLINKRISNDRIRSSIYATRKQGIAVGVSVMVGVPGERESDITATVDLLKAVAMQKAEPAAPPLPDVMVSPAFYAVYHGTAAETAARRSGLVIDYIAGHSREDIWLHFDDGLGALHVHDAHYASRVLSILRTNTGMGVRLLI